LKKEAKEKIKNSSVWGGFGFRLFAHGPPWAREAAVPEGAAPNPFYSRGLRMGIFGTIAPHNGCSAEK